MVSFELISHLNPDLMLLHPNMIKRKLTIIPCVLIDKQRKDSIIKIGLNFLSSSDLQEVFPFVSMLRAGFTTFKTRIDSNLKIDSNIASIAFISYGDIEDVSSGLSTVTGQKRQSTLKEENVNQIQSKAINQEEENATKSDIKQVLDRLDRHISESNEILNKMLLLLTDLRNDTRENSKVLKLIANKLQVKLPNEKHQTKTKTVNIDKTHKDNAKVQSVNSNDTKMQNKNPTTKPRFLPCTNSSKSFLNPKRNTEVKSQLKSKEQTLSNK